jgi:hypothetical protein
MDEKSVQRLLDRLLELARLRQIEPRTFEEAFYNRGFQDALADVGETIKRLLEDE